jgi:hypothetical protein
MTKVKVAGISTCYIEAEELDSPLAGRAGVVVVYTTLAGVEYGSLL